MTNQEQLLALADKWEAEIQVAYNDYAYGQRCAFEQAAGELRKLIRPEKSHGLPNARLLVERLREPDGGIFAAHELCRLAADEIDRLLRGFSMVKEFSDGSSRAWAIAYEALYHRPYTVTQRKL